MNRSSTSTLRTLVFTLSLLCSSLLCFSQGRLDAEDVQIAVDKEEKAALNVLMIAIDDLNDWIGCLNGHPQASTPNLDRLAKRSVLFTNAHCQAPICNPSRTSLMLGLRPSTTGIYLNSPWFRQTKLNRDRITLPQYFGKHGYKTMTAGKIYHGSRVDPNSFEIVGPRPGQRLKIDRKIIANVPSKSKLWDFGPQSYDEDKFGDAISASWTIQQLNSKHDRPFFLAVGFYRPHVPLYAPVRFFKQHPLDQTKLPVVQNNDRNDLPEEALKLTENPTPPSHRWFVESGNWKKAVQSYLSAVSFTDAQVGRVLDALDKSRYASNTLIVLFSDHGFHLGEKERWAKQSLWERSTRVPLMIALPLGLKGERCSRPVELLSIYPTLLEICGLPAKQDLEGTSIVPLLENPKANWTLPAITTYFPNNHAIRTERYRYIQYQEGAEEFYDHQHDPREWKNLSSDPAVTPLKKSHARWLPKVNVPMAKGNRR